MPRRVDEKLQVAGPVSRDELIGLALTDENPSVEEQKRPRLERDQEWQV